MIELNKLEKRKDDIISAPVVATAVDDEESRSLLKISLDDDDGDDGSESDDDIERGCGDKEFVEFLPDAAVGFGAGTVISMLIIMVLFLVDGNSALSLKDVVSKMMSNNETLAVLEKTAGLHFMTNEEFVSIHKETANSSNTLIELQLTLGEKTKEYEKKEKELKLLRGGDGIKHMEAKLGLDKWCGSCIWKMGTNGSNCNVRYNYVMSNYKHTDATAKLVIMEADPQCKELDAYQWCGNCIWEDDSRCNDRLKFFQDNHKVPSDTVAKTWVAHEAPHCKLDLDKWCGTCIWKGGMNCDTRFNYVIGKYKHTEEVAKMGIMHVEPQCENK